MWEMEAIEISNQANAADAKSRAADQRRYVGEPTGNPGGQLLWRESARIVLSFKPEIRLK